MRIFVFMSLSYLNFFIIINPNLWIFLKIWEKCNKYQNDICDSPLSSIRADKSDQFVPKVSNDIPIEILIFVRSEGTEKKLLNISSDICDKTFRFISADTSVNLYQKSAMIFILKYSSFSDLKEVNRKY